MCSTCLWNAANGLGSAKPVFPLKYLDSFCLCLIEKADQYTNGKIIFLSTATMFSDFQILLHSLNPGKYRW